MLARAIPAVVAGPGGGRGAGPLRPQAHHDRERPDPRGGGARRSSSPCGSPRPWLLYALSALLMFASPFFTSGRAAILPTIATPARTAHRQLPDPDHAVGHPDRRHHAGRVDASARLGYEWAFVINALSFLFSACGHRETARRRAVSGPGARPAAAVVRPWHEYREGLRYMRSVPLIFGIAMISVGWATGGGAAQILFALFGEQVFHRGAAGIGEIWGFAGVGLLHRRRGGARGRPPRGLRRLQAHHHDRLPARTASPTCCSARCSSTGRRCC